MSLSKIYRHYNQRQQNAYNSHLLAEPSYVKLRLQQEEGVVFITACLSHNLKLQVNQTS